MLVTCPQAARWKPCVWTLDIADRKQRERDNHGRENERVAPDMNSSVARSAEVQQCRLQREFWEMDIVQEGLRNARRRAWLPAVPRPTTWFSAFENILSMRVLVVF